MEIIKERSPLQRFKKAVAYATLATGLLAGLASPLLVHADTTSATTNATVTITPGPINLSANQSTTAITTAKNLDGSGESGYANSADAGTLILTDARGTGAGYNVTATASELTQRTHKLSGSNLNLNNVSVNKVDSTSGDVPTSTVTGTTAIDDNASNTLVNQKADTTNGSGMGSYKINLNKLNFAGNLPANVYAGTYSTTVTYTVANGPENAQ